MRPGSAFICGWRRRHRFRPLSPKPRAVDLSPGRFATLLLIGRNPGISQTALAAANGRDKSTLTPILEDLERRGFVVRERMKTDRRSYQLTLTEAGKKMLDQLTVCAKRHDDNLDRIIGAKDRAKFLQILQKIATEIGRDELTERKASAWPKSRSIARSKVSR